MENTITQKIGWLSDNLMTGMLDRTICTTSQPVKPVIASFLIFYAKTKHDMETPKHKILNNALILAHRK